MIMPGQCLTMPSCTCANSAGLELGVSSRLRTWICATLAPASNASCVDSICSLGVTGTAGVSALRGIAPVIATVIIAGVVMGIPGLLNEMDRPDVAPLRDLLEQRD